MTARRQEDDQDIQQEGLESLTEDELRQACRARGMRAPFGEGAADFMRRQLAEWIDWSLNKCAPDFLLVFPKGGGCTGPQSRWGWCMEGWRNMAVRGAIGTVVIMHLLLR